MKNYKYALYAFCSDDEGGYGVCLYDKFTPDVGYDRFSGPHAMPSTLICGFNTVDEAVEVIFDQEWDTREGLAMEIRELVYVLENEDYEY